MMRTQSAGGIVLNERGEIALVKNGPSFWGFPKGHVNGTEDELSAARREIYEETGIGGLQLVRKLGTYERFRGSSETSADDLRELKIIHMYLFTTPQKELQPLDANNPEARWFSFEDALETLTHAKDRAFLEAHRGTFAIGL